MSLTLDDVTKAYVTTREEIRGLKSQIEKLDELQEKRASYLLGQLQKDNLQNVKTNHGTVYTALKESVTVADWDAVVDYVIAPLKEMLECSLGVGGVDMRIIKNQLRLEVLNKAVNKTACLEQMGDDRSQAPLPGVNYSAVRVAQIRKS